MRYLATVAASIIVCALLLLVLFVVQLGGPTEKTDWVAGVYAKKEASLAEAQGKRILLVAGSNVLVGLSAKQLDGQWGYAARNFGTHAGLSLPYLLYRTTKNARKGDIVILALEYRQYAWAGVSDILLDYVMARDPGYFWQAPLALKWEFVQKTHVPRMLEGIKGHIADPKPRPGRYGAHNINDFGDQIGNEPEKMPASMRNHIKRLKAYPNLPKRIHADFEKTMDDYLAWAKEAGVCVIGMPGSMLYFDAYRERPFMTLTRSIKTYYDDRKVAWIGDPFDYLFQAEHMYDTPNHLNAEGVRIRTERLVRDIGADIDSHCPDR